MSATLLTTKLHIPRPLPRVVPRPRLIERLNEGLHRKLTLVSAPAGFGKTTLVSEWVSEADRPIAWLSLDEGDSDPTRVLTYLVAALQTVSPNLGEGVLGALQSPQPPPIESMLTVLLNEISTLPEKFILVLDDYHLIDAKPIDDALAFLLEHLPPQVHLVIATREDPHLPLARLRARGHLTELRAADLRFTSSEAAEFLNQVMGLGLTADDIAALESRTEGWIAGLQLAALSMQGRGDVPGFIRAFAGDDRYIVDYLIEEVLQRQPEHVRSFLLETSILDRLSGPLCDAVTGQDDGKTLLETLQRGNLFVVPLDDKRRLFRYHHLFGDVLQVHATDEQPDQIPIRHRRASEWYERNGLPSEAIRHALAARDFERAANLIELASLEMLLSRQEETFNGWLYALPGDVVRVRPVLSAYFALSLVSTDLEAAGPHLQNAERLLNERLDSPSSVTCPEHSRRMVVVDHEGFRTLPGLLEIIRAYRAGAFGDVSGSVEHARKALDVLPEDDLLWRGAAASLLGLAYWTSGELDAAHRSFADGIALLRMTGDVTQSLSGWLILADIRTAQGRLRDAAGIYEEALDLATEHLHPLPPPAADLYVGMSELRLQHNDLEAAERHLFASRAISEHGGISENRHRWYIAMARISVARGDLDRALELLDESERLYVRSPDPYVRPISALKARVWIRQGRMDRALGWMRDQDLSVDDDLSYLREFEHITFARLLIARYGNGRSESSIRDANALLERLREAAEDGGRIGSLIEILVLQAIAHEAQGNAAGALAPLERALILAEPEGYVRVFVDEGMPIARLLTAAVARGIAPDYTSTILAAFEAEGLMSGESPRPPAAGTAQPLIEPLSQRELEVLQLIAQGLSNREISDRLFVALSTVKGHNRIIFDKLQVRRRTEAVARARELGLLEG
jgi:LuxR family transcriptional regulator, maltose regulon positive regulatory protein